LLSGGVVGTIQAMTQLSPSPPLDRILDLERELQTPACRADAARLEKLLAPDFVEVGASGRRWDFSGIMAMLQEESADGSTAGIRVSGLSARALAPGVVQVFWDSERAGRRARRTSIWCERGGDWQQVYHQGTLLP
jgi:hypothetical protein